jgi:thioredoxin reductase
MVRNAGLAVEFGSRVDDLCCEDGVWLARSGDRTWRARQVILALGRRGTPRKLQVPGEDLPKVMYRLVDADTYRAQRILIVGGGDSAAEAAVGLARTGANSVALSYRREKLVRIKKKNLEAIERMISNGRIEPILPSEVEAIEPDRVHLRVSSEGTRTLENDYVFVFAGGVPPFAFLERVGVQFGGTPDSAVQ